MRKSSPLLLAALLNLGGAAAFAAPSADPSTAFYYGANLSAAALSHFDQVVVKPSLASPAELAELTLLRRRGSEVFAYVSISELSRLQASAVDVRFRLSESASGSTVVMNAEQPEWQQWLLTQTFAPLWERGFRAFYLDDLDSYQNILTAAPQRAAQVKGLVQIIQALHQRFPGIRLLLHRGFALLPEVSSLVVGVVADSLFRGLNPLTQEYVEQDEAERSKLLAELRIVRDLYHLPVTVVDYVPAEQRTLTRTTAQRIAALGMTPWVSNATLSVLGVGAVEPLPRRILAVYSGAEQRRDRGDYIDVAYTPVHMMAAAVLEYLGYAIEYVDAGGSLPSGPLADRYAGIVTWFTDDRVPNPTLYRDWLLRQVSSGMPVAILDHLGIAADPMLQQAMGLVRKDGVVPGEVRLLCADPQATGFEVQVTARQNVFYPLEVKGGAVQRLLSVQDSRGERMDAVFTTGWGGMAANPYLIDEGPLTSYRWIINPFVFFTQALKLKPLPAPDVTTLLGRRLLIVHIDGDGFASRAEMPGNQYSGQVIYEQILKRYPVKATVSIIEGEVGAYGKWPKLSPALEAIARDIFSLPSVEVASHSYSHPFDWLRYGQDQEDGDINGMFRYDFSLRREVDDSVAYINRRLAPPHKPVKVFLWSGEAIAPTAALAQVQSIGLLNMNGGNTVISSRNPTLTTVSPMGRPSSPYYQVYAPVQNENVFTNLWRGPFYGFRDVISTFQLTDKPRRMKPINIYFHFYSGSKIGSLKVLQQVFDWALAQPVVSVYASDYIRKVEDFQGITLAQRLDGCWQLRGDGQLTTLRIPGGPSDPTVDSARSLGVLAVHDLDSGRYVSLDTTGRAILCLAPAARSVDRPAVESGTPER